MGELHPQASKQLQEDDLFHRVMRRRIVVGKRVLNAPSTGCFYGGDFVWGWLTQESCITKWAVLQTLGPAFAAGSQSPVTYSAVNKLRRAGLAASPLCPSPRLGNVNKELNEGRQTKWWWCAKEEADFYTWKTASKPEVNQFKKEVWVLNTVTQTTENLWWAVGVFPL